MTTTAPPPAPTVPRQVVALPCSPHSPAVARRVTARWLEAADYARTADAVLIVSELVTNAVRHTDGPCELTLTAHHGTVDIAVTDHSEDLPDLPDLPDLSALPDLRRTPGGVAAGAGGGRGARQGGLGLEIVRRLGAAITVVPRLGGKTVHAALRPHAPEHERRGPP
ncbi:ATP-binding protein [Streptomyces sp. NPDC047971]|uniref:ATP-binding protein n=1 Tax=Streptomyces sp. NPDC047971 TaxID=3154499 RepID=UPI0034102D84